MNGPSRATLEGPHTRDYPVFLAGFFCAELFFAAFFLAVFLGLRPLTASACSASSSTAYFSVSFHGCGTSSRQAMAPTCTLPSLDITVMFRPAPWKIGPSG